MQAARDASRLKAATLRIGQGASAALAPSAEVRYVATPEKPGDPAKFGGLFEFAVEKAGTYRVALGSGAWVDVLRGKKIVASSAHGHGPECSGVRKMVDFPLASGRYTLQIAGSGTAELQLLVARLP